MQDGLPTWQVPEFSMDDLAPAEAPSLHRPRYMETRQHDHEASGSRAQTADASADPWQSADASAAPW